MTRFLDVRLAPVGGTLATAVAITQGTNIDDYTGLDQLEFRADVRGRHVLIGTHGFNVNRADGIASLANWEGQLQLPFPPVFIGVLWPGDSIWAHGLDYPGEPRVANETAQVIAPFLDAHFGDAASVSFASHSLGARVVLETISLLHMPVRRATVMAGAIDDNCLNTDFQATASKIGEISVLASKKDDVLSAAFPLGNFVAGIIAEGHPWWHAALGHKGPSRPTPPNFQTPFEIPESWDFGHGDYLRIAPFPQPQIALPVDVPPNNSTKPATATGGWQAAWTAAFSSNPPFPVNDYAILPFGSPSITSRFGGERACVQTD